MKDPQPIEIEEAEVERLIEQAQQGQLDAAAQKRIVPLLRTLVWLQRTLLETRISLAKLQEDPVRQAHREAARENPQSRPTGPTDSSGERGGHIGSAAKRCRGRRASGQPMPIGRNAHRASRRVLAATCKSRHRDRVMVASGRRIIPAPRRVFAPMMSYQAGDRCPACARGRLYPSRPLVRLRFDRATAGEGHPL